MMGCLSVLFISETWIRERTYSYILIRYSLYSEIKIRYKAYSEIPIRKKAYIFTLSLSFFHAFPFIGVKLQFIVFIALIILKIIIMWIYLKKLLHLLCFFLTYANKNIDILIKSFFMGKFLQLKRCLAAAVIAFLGVTATWADATVVYEADMSQTNEPDGWKCYKPKDDKGTWTTGN